MKPQPQQEREAGTTLTDLMTPAGRWVRYPFPQARAGQLEGIDTIAGILQDGNYALFCAGTGFGKSPVLMGLASLFESAWLIVGDNVLVEQWRGDYAKLPHVGCMKSRSQFECSALAGSFNHSEDAYTCSTGKSRCKKSVEDVVEWTEKTDEALAKAYPDGVPKTRIPLVLRSAEAKAALGPEIAPGRYEARGVRQCAQQWASGFSCPYADNRDLALSQPYTIMTTAMALTLFTHLSEHPAMKPRQLMVVDECQNIENDLIKHYEVTIRSSWVSDLLGANTQLGTILSAGDPIFAAINPSTTIIEFLALDKPTDLDRAGAWLENVERLALAKKQTLAKGDHENHDKIDDFTRRIKNTRDVVHLNVPFHFELTQFQDEGQYEVRVVPLEARGIFDAVMGHMAQHCVFTSATTGTAELFRNSHAMARNVVYAEGGIPFPVENRPIKFTPFGSLSSRTFEAHIRKLADGVAALACQSRPGERDDHANQKGLIHTVSGKVLDQIVAAFNRCGQGSRLVVLQGEGKQRNEVVNAFKQSSEPLIMISPSAMQGLSLNDEMGRWQIICKVPFPRIDEPTVAHRKEIIRGWYDWQAAKNMIQAFGRVVRSAEDWGITYIVDEAFRYHYWNNKALYPKYIQEAIKGL